MTITSDAIVRGTLFAIAATLVLAHSIPADAARISPLKIGAWKGGAYSNNATNKFSHCAVSAKYKNGMTLLISVTGDKNWSVGFARNVWNLSVGSKQPVRFKVDSGSSYSGIAVSKTTHLAQVQLPSSSTLFRQFRDGRKFFVKTRRSEFSFNLTNMRRVLPSLVKCARHHAMVDTDPFDSTSQHKDPFGSNPSWETSQFKPVPRGPTPQTRAEAFSAVSYMLGKANIQARYINASENRHLLAKNDVAWSLNGSVGTFRVMPQETGDFDSIRQNIIKTDKKSCAGYFQAKVEGQRSPAANAFMTGCDNVKNAERPLGMAVYYALLPRREGGKYLISIIGKLDNSGKIRALGMHLTDIAVALNAKGSVPKNRRASF